MNQPNLESIARLLRYYIIISTTEAGSGHPTSSLSAVELMATLFFDGFFKTDLENPNNPNNDRLIFSKGHASPLFYALYAAAGKLTEAELLTLRKFDSPLEGHPTLNFPYTEAATGSLGQGLSIGVGMALNAKKVDKLPYRTFVLLGDSEMAEGSVWEAIAAAEFYKLNNLIGIIDVNRLGQRGQTMYGHNIEAFEKRVAAFGWETVVIDGHDLASCHEAFKKAVESPEKPTMIIAKTLKGKGISFIEDKDNWHGKPLSKDDLAKALVELGDIDKNLRGTIAAPENTSPQKKQATPAPALQYDTTKAVATRRAYGNALVRLADAYPDIVVLDAETSNSTYAEFFKKDHADRFFEMYIAEQNMVGTALGFARRGKVPFVSSFAAFLSRAFDQIRMLQYSDGNVKVVGSHAGVSIGEDGSSQMGLEDIAMFRTLLGSTVLYPSDAISAEKLIEEAAKHHGSTYIRTTRKDTAILYEPTEQFPIGGSKTLRHSSADSITVIGAGVTLHEALAAYDILKAEGITIRVIDLYSVKPLDIATLKKAATETKAIITVEDHFVEGGIGEAVSSALSTHATPIHLLAVRKMPRSGKPQELLDFEEISTAAIVKKVKEIA
ncbi:MAG: transketolase [bacterium]